MEKLLTCWLALICFSGSGLFGQIYPVSALPDSLKENAHYIIREYDQRINLISSNKVNEQIKKVITVLDTEGEKEASLFLQYDKNCEINIKQIVFYDRNGKKIKSAKQSEIADYSTFSSFMLFSDNRIKYFKPDYPDLPYTIEYDYEKSRSNLISLGVWMPVSDYEVSLQHATLKLTHPVDVIINKKEINIKGNSQEVKNGTISETWELNNKKAIEEEPFDCDISERVSSVYLMPSVLNYDRYKGKADNWKEYGQWIYSLYQGKDIPGERDTVKINAIIREISDTPSRIKALYSYMQENTRYVAVQLGLGGYQPFDARTVSQTGYGDCKALSNYLYAILKYAGIESFPALVSAGTDNIELFGDFPSFSQLNHVILCVPQKTDTIWLECTSQNIPFGFLGDFTDDRDVLLITGDGGKFAHTTRYDEKDNLKTCRSEFNIDSLGTASCRIKTRFSGLQYDNIFSFLNSNYDERKKWLYSNSSLPTLQIKEFSVAENKNRLPDATINETAVSKNYCSFSGNYMILPVNLMNSQKPVKRMLKERKSDVLIRHSFTDYDTIVYRLPRSFKVESLPSGTVINSDFGTYTCSYSSNGNEITYTRKFNMKKGRFKPSDYKGFYEFILAISKNDNAKIILTKKT